MYFYCKIRERNYAFINELVSKLETLGCHFDKEQIQFHYTNSHESSDDEVLSLLYNDNITEFVSYLKDHPAYDPEKSIIIILIQMDDYYFYNYRPISIAAFYGSTQCFKYLFLNGYDDDEICNCAVAGGNLEIIHILEQKGYSFSNCFETSVFFHRTEISNWIIQHYDLSFDVNEILHFMNYYNMKAFLYAQHNNHIISFKAYNLILTASEFGFREPIQYLISCLPDQDDFYNYAGGTLIYYCLKKQHYDLLKYFLATGKVNIHQNNFFGVNVLEYIVDEKNTDIVVYLTEKCGLNKEELYSKSNLLISAFKRKKYVLGNRLIELNLFDKDSRDSEGKTPLLIATKNSCFEEIKTLIETFQVNKFAIDNSGNNILHYAASIGNIEIIDYLLDKYQFDINVQNLKGLTILHIACINGKERHYDSSKG